MSPRESSILRPEQAAYLDRLVPPRDKLRSEMEAYAAERGLTCSRPEVGRLLEVLARLSAGRRIVEIGTGIGYGTLSLALGSPESRILTVDRDASALAAARSFLRRAEVLDRVELAQGEAVELLGRLEPGIDLAYLDGDTASHRRCLDLVLPKLRVGGALVAGGVLAGGQVAEPADDTVPAEAAEADAALAFNGYFMMHPQLASVVLPLGSGVGIASKTRPLISEMGGPY